jgi:hypothetical protein
MTKLELLKLIKIKGHAELGIEHLDKSGKKWEPKSCFLAILRIVEELENKKKKDDPVSARAD